MSSNTIDIHSGGPHSGLSNFVRCHFAIDDVECHSMEGFLQSLKFDQYSKQVEVCKLTGFVAKKEGQKRNLIWQRSQILWWRGIPYRRLSREYQDLLIRAYKAMHDQSKTFRDALASTGDATLTHRIGSSDESKTILTEAEFCEILHYLRDGTPIPLREPLTSIFD